MLGARLSHDLLGAPGVRRLTSDAKSGGFWSLWKAQEEDRRARWEEGRQVRAAHLENERQQWERIRESWRHLGESREEKEQRQRQHEQTRGRVTWWWEDPAGGTRRASAEDIKKFAERNFGRNSDRASAGRAEPRVPQTAAVRDDLSHYAALGLHSDAQRRCPPQELRSAFERVAKATHPDTAAVGENAMAAPSAAAMEQRTQRFRRAKAAYDFLRDPERRARYDGT